MKIHDFDSLQLIMVRLNCYVPKRLYTYDLLALLL